MPRKLLNYSAQSLWGEQKQLSVLLRASLSRPKRLKLKCDAQAPPRRHHADLKSGDSGFQSAYNGGVAVSSVGSRRSNVPHHASHAPRTAEPSFRRSLRPFIQRVRNLAAKCRELRRKGREREREEGRKEASRRRKKGRICCRERLSSNVVKWKLRPTSHNLGTY